MINFEVKAEGVLKLITEMLSRSNDLQPVLMEIRGKQENTNPKTIIGGYGKAFSSKGASIGVSWPPLKNAEYIRRKALKYPNGTLLIASGAMYHALVWPGSTAMGKKGVTGTVEILEKNKLSYGIQSPYAGFHQTGTKKMSMRKYSAITDDQRRAWKSLIGSFILENREGEP